METHKTYKRRMKVKLIFNPGSGDNNESPLQLIDIIREMQAWKLVPEVYLTEPDSDTYSVVRDAVKQGIRMFAVCGGDGTVSAVARALVDTDATLGIIPTGTQNNVAYSLGIPTDIPSAVALLRTGRRLRIDTGIVTCGSSSTPFIEICSLGLFSTLFPASDEIQHGNISKIGDFLAALVTFPVSELQLLLDDAKGIQFNGHMVLVTNMSYVARHYRVGNRNSYRDGLLDVLVFADISKLTLVNHMIQGTEKRMLENSQIQHFQVRKVIVQTNPAMTVMADGVKLGEGSAHIEIKPRALLVIVGRAALDRVDEPGKNHEI